MAHTAHQSAEELEEIFESETEMIAKAKQLAEWIQSSQHCVIFTGAGISTSAGIPDFRGPQGVWTLAAQGKTARSRKPLHGAVPTTTHMAIRALVDVGLVKHVISQNTDGMHRKSGIAKHLSELHGNTNVEVCKGCAREYLRDYGVRSARGVFQHATGRHCTVPGCGAALHDTIVNFGESLPAQAFNSATRHSKASDLHVVLGSSLRVSPACELPEQTATLGGRLVIVNLQRTPLDDKAALRVHGPCDTFMAEVMRNLQIQIPPFVVQRHVVMWRTPGYATVAGLEEDGIPATLFSNVQCPSGILPEEPFMAPCPLQEPWEVQLTFFGHYHEPLLTLTLPAGQSRMDFNLLFDPLRDTCWKVHNVDAPSKLPFSARIFSLQGADVRAQSKSMSSSSRSTGNGTLTPGGSDKGAARHLSDCPHTQKSIDVNGMPLNLQAPCQLCGTTEANLQCLTCHLVRCGPHAEGHMQQHYKERGHPLVVDLHDVSFWCYKCKAYLDEHHKKLLPLHQTLGEMKLKH